MADSISCPCCAGSQGYEFATPSFRTGDWRTFRYRDCDRCGTLYLIDRVDPTPFYDGYFSMVKRTPSDAWARRALGEVANQLVLRSERVGARVAQFEPRPYWLNWFAGTGVRLDSRIVDVGCGSGGVLLDLARHGFTQVSGIDPYLDDDIAYENGVTIKKANVTALDAGAYDACIAKHVIEHTDDPRGFLSALASALRPSGTMIIEVPVAQGPIWQEFRENWVAMDAPIHRFVPSQLGLELLAEASGMAVVRRYGEITDYHLLRSAEIAQRIPPGKGPAPVGPARRSLTRKMRHMDLEREAPQMSFIMKKEPR